MSIVLTKRPPSEPAEPQRSFIDFWSAQLPKWVAQLLHRARSSPDPLAAVTLPRQACLLEAPHDRGDDPLAVREDMIFEDRTVRYRHLQGADPLHRGFE